MSRRDLSEGRRPKGMLQKTNKGNSTYVILVNYFIVKAGKTIVQKIMKKARKTNRLKGNRSSDKVIQNPISFIEVKIQNAKKKESGPTVLSRLWSL